MPETRPPETLADLTGWKDVAAYLGRSVRTVQRWERELGLPVRRVRTQAGEVIYARRGELDGWLASRSTESDVEANGDSGDAGDGVVAADGEPPAPRYAADKTRRSRPPASWLWVGGLVLVAAAGFGLSRGWRVAGTRTQPSSWTVEDGALAIRDSAGRLLWTHRFDFPLAADAMKSNDYEYDNANAEWVVLVDLDGDGQTEVLVVPIGQRGYRPLHCFESDGQLRFKHEVRRSVRFGGEAYGPPFAAMPPYVVTRGKDTTIWAPSLHTPFFPAVIQKLTPTGQVAGEFWQAGHPGRLREIERAGQRLLLVGGTRNEDFSAALSVLDADDPTGTAPADIDKYHCEDCPPEAPLAYLSFPRLEVGRMADQRAVVREIRDVAGGLMVMIHYLTANAPGGPCGGSDAYYRLDDAFRIVSADFGDAYLHCHAQLRLGGRLDHDFGPRDVAELFPVRAWYKGVPERIDRPVPPAPTGMAAR